MVAYYTGLFYPTDELIRYCGAERSMIMQEEILNPGNIQLIKPDNDILRLHILYLEKIEQLTDEERELFRRFFSSYANPLFVV